MKFDLREGGREVLEAALSATDQPGRTQYFEIVNETTQFNLTLVLAEGYDESASIPQGFEKDTGLTVTGTDVVPGTTQKGVIQPQINVQVTLAKCSLHWKRTVDPYDEGDLNLQDQTAPAGEFFIYVGWAVTEKAAQGKQPSILARHKTGSKKK
jgi:hypothetical protein